MRVLLSISNFKLMAKRLGAILLLTVSIAFVFARFFKVVQYPHSDFADFKFIGRDKVDVLCVGSSHVYCGINPVQMYDDYGIAAFDLAAGSQSVWFSYYYINEALKTQSPKVVILDVYTLPTEDAYFDSKIEGNLINMPWSYNKWNALKTAGAENKAELFFQFPIVHSRYDKLDRNDFDMENHMRNGMFLGYNYQTRIEPYPEDFVPIDVSKVWECVPISLKAEEYLRKSIELCQGENIEIVLTNTPWPNITGEIQKKYNYIQTIADEYEVPFLNGCLYNDEIGMDYTVDSMGDGGHLNYSGVSKYTKWLSDWLKENYELQDRRLDSRWSEWEYQSNGLKEAILRDTLAKTTDMESILDLIEDNENVYYVISLNGDFHSDVNENVIQVLADRGFDVSMNGTYVKNASEELFFSGGENGYNYWQYFGDSVLNVYEEESSQMICWNNEKYSMVENGVNVVIYDRLLDAVIGRFGFDAGK